MTATSEAASGRPWRRRIGIGIAVLGLVALTAACDPGYTYAVAGDGGVTTSGDGGPAVEASLHAPSGLATVPGGGYIINDAADCTIRKVDADKVITTVAGTGTCGDSGDGGPATSAKIKFVYPSLPGGVDDAGNIYFIQEVGGTVSRVRKISAGGTISTVPGTQASSPEYPIGLVVAGDGTVTLNYGTFSGSSLKIIKVSPTGLKSTLTSTSLPTLLQCGLASLGGGMYAVEGGIDYPTIYRVNAATGAATPIPGVTLSAICSPMAAAPDGTIYAVNNNHQVIRIDTNNNVILLAGDGNPDPGHVQAAKGTNLSLTPLGLALTPNDGLLISSGHEVYRLGKPADVTGN